MGTVVHPGTIPDADTVPGGSWHHHHDCGQAQAMADQDDAEEADDHHHYPEGNEAEENDRRCGWIHSRTAHGRGDFADHPGEDGHWVADAFDGSVMKVEKEPESSLSWWAIR